MDSTVMWSPPTSCASAAMSVVEVITLSFFATANGVANVPSASNSAPRNTRLRYVIIRYSSVLRFEGARLPALPFRHPAPRLEPLPDAFHNLKRMRSMRPQRKLQLHAQLARPQAF